MSEVRSAGPDDAPELVRLRGVMFTAMDGEEPPPGRWQAEAEQGLRAGLAQPDGPLAAFVVDRPDSAGELAACAIGGIERRIPGPRSPTGRCGYVSNVVTDPDCRRRGYSRMCMVALLDWCRTCDVDEVELRASEVGEPLYRSLGFVRPTRYPMMRLRLP